MSVRSFIDEITLDELEDDPYPVYARLRAEAPVAWIPAADAWFVTSFDACAAVGGGEYGFVGARNHPTLERVFGDPNVLTAEGEAHADLRKGIDPRLQPRPVNEMIDDLVRPIARQHLAMLGDRTDGELMADYFEPVSVDALRSVMGLDGIVDSDTLRRWFRDLNLGVANFGLEPEHFAIADQASDEIEATLMPLIDRLRKHPDESMLSHMLWAGREGGEPRSIDFLMPSIKVILLGGMQEPGHAAGSTLLGLFGEPEQWELLRSSPEEYIPLAVHEGMRWIAPIGAVERMSTRDVEVFDQQVPAGAMVEVVLGSANRDETRFEEADRFDMERANRVNQAFGNGVHFCAGHFFARQVQRIMFEELLPALPGLRPDPAAAPTVTGWVFRAPKTFPALWDRPQPARDTAALAGPIAVEPAAGLPDTLRARVVSMRLETPDILAVELVAADGGELPAWTPGAHIDLWPTVDRAGQYSLCGDREDRHRYRIAVLREEHSGGVSAFVHERLRVGDVVTIGEPRNHFELRPASSVTFIAGGIGITPILPMARAAIAGGAAVEIEYCGRRAEHLAFLPELKALGGPLRLHQSTDGTRADLAELVAGAAARQATVYACGPERMLDELESLGERFGTPVVMERFTGVEAHLADDRPFELRLDRSGRTLTVGADESAIEVLRREGYDIRFSCRQGNCGSCETHVLDGIVEHRDVVLTPAQHAKHDRMMVCVSRAHGERIVLDL